MKTKAIILFIVSLIGFGLTFVPDPVPLIDEIILICFSVGSLLKSIRLFLKKGPDPKLLE